MEDDFALGRHKIADQGRDADPKIDRPPLRDVLREARRQCLGRPERLPGGLLPSVPAPSPVYAVSSLSGGSPVSICTTRFT